MNLVSLLRYFSSATWFFMITLLTGISCNSSAQSSESTRLITAGGSITETVFALNKQDLIVATDSTSRYPRAANSITKLGYFRQLSAEGILAQNPTILIGADATGPNVALEQVVAAGAAVHIVNHDKTLDGLLAMIKEIGDLLNAKQKAHQLVEYITGEVAKIQSSYGHKLKHSHLKGLYIVATNDRGFTVAGKNTVPDALFSTLNIENVADEIEKYKLMSNEAIIAANPDFILVAGHTIHSEASLFALCQQAAISQTTAGKNCYATAMDSSYSLGLSPRFPIALKKIADVALSSVHSNVEKL